MKNQDTVRSLILEIEQQVQEFLKGDIQPITFGGYLRFRDDGSRKESENDYFKRRQQLSAFSCCFLYRKPNKQEKDYFQELLWAVLNEYTWVLAAHIKYDEHNFIENSAYEIDLFSAETGMCLSEIYVKFGDWLDPLLKQLIKKRVYERIIYPFMQKSFSFENTKSNWNSVCSSSVGMIAMMLCEVSEKKDILERVDKALDIYINGFGKDGICEEGIGYWVYGVGFLCYYLDMRIELDKQFILSSERREKIKKIGNFPFYMQYEKGKFVTFSDVPPNTEVPTGLMSYLSSHFDVESIIIDLVTKFDFDHCYRYAHCSRNLLWTNDINQSKKISDFVKYFEENQWLLQRKGSIYFGFKGGTNMEEHNHNDVGSFMLAVDGEQFFADLGAGQYNKEYFKEERYLQTHTRSYWHNLPTINQMEEISTSNSCIKKALTINEPKVSAVFELKNLYANVELQSFTRNLDLNLTQKEIMILDSFQSEVDTEINEGLVSYIKPYIAAEGEVIFKGKTSQVTLFFDSDLLDVTIEEIEDFNHFGQMQKIYRLALLTRKKQKKIGIKMKILIEEIKN